LTQRESAHSINGDLYKLPLFGPESSGQRPNRETRAIPSPARIRGTFIAWAVRPEDLSALRVFHKALADVNRLRIVQRLAGAPASVTELIDHVGLSQPLVSHHLRRLREAGLIETQRRGRETVCTLRPEAFDDINARERAILGYERAPRAADLPAAAVPPALPANPRPNAEPAR
jgi:DNA-binding transcriptional ArsR family regulator